MSIPEAYRASQDFSYLKMEVRICLYHSRLQVMRSGPFISNRTAISWILYFVIWGMWIDIHIDGEPPENVSMGYTWWGVGRWTWRTPSDVQLRWSYEKLDTLVLGVQSVTFLLECIGMWDHAITGTDVTTRAYPQQYVLTSPSIQRWPDINTRITNRRSGSAHRHNQQLAKSRDLHISSIRKLIAALMTVQTTGSQSIRQVEWPVIVHNTPINRLVLGEVVPAREDKAKQLLHR